jgi:hypothetical protein
LDPILSLTAAREVEPEKTAAMALMNFIVLLGLIQLKQQKWYFIFLLSFGSNSER